MFTRRTLLVIAFVVALLMVAGIGTWSGAIAHGLNSAKPGVTVPYPGRLANASGQWVPDGSYSFIFELYDAENGGTRLWSETQQDVLVKGGAFAVTLGALNSLPLGQPQDGNRWLAVAVRGPGETGFTSLTPRQPFGTGSCGASPSAPAAAGAACPHDHLGEVWSANIGWSNAGLKINNSGSGPSFWGTNSGGGNGVRGTGTGTSIGVYGEAAQVAGVAGRSSGKNGVEGYSSAPDVWAGVYGEAPHYGVFGRATTATWYGVFSDGAMETTGNLYVGGSLFVTGSKAGYVVDIVKNDDTVPLELGDSVMISGAEAPVLGNIPVIKVRRATVETNAVVGVVDQHYIPSPAGGGPDSPAKIPATSEDAPVAPGQYLTVVTLGSFRAIKVDASFGAISPGDLLIASSNSGYAMKATSPKPGTVIGKALSALPSGKGTIPVIITLQ